MRKNRTALRIVAAMITLVVLAAVAVFAWTVALPWSANHYGFALPGGTDGLPYRIHYNGRSYATRGHCARAGWCDTDIDKAFAYISRDTVQSHGEWPLTQVTTVSTFLGSSYPVLTHTPPAGTTTAFLYIPDGPDRYIPYTIEGGV